MSATETPHGRRLRFRQEREAREREQLESNPTYVAAKRIYASLPKEDPLVTYNRRAALMRELQNPLKEDR